jgi:hypothetical protein
MELKLSDLEKELVGLSIMETVVNSERFNSSEKECLEAIYHRINTLTLVKEPPQSEYYSERGFPLITQSILDSNDESNGMLTVENDKWYRMYRITREGEVKPVDYEDVVESRLGLTWVDHAVSPESFHLTAKKLGLEYDDRTFAMVCERFVTDYLEDWSKLAHHLPVVEG